jgi:alkaline phosphatase
LGNLAEQSITLQTYCINYQVADSACSATALFSGVKNNFMVVGLSGDATLLNCTAQQDPKNHINSIFKYAQDAGMATGIVTNTRITHATPAATYANAGHRSWEGNEGVPTGCSDIALQLITGQVGSKLDVALGGGSRSFRPTSFIDRNGRPGRRTDNRNLIDDFIRVRTLKRQRPVFVETRVSRIVQFESKLFTLQSITG